MRRTITTIILVLVVPLTASTASARSTRRAVVKVAKCAPGHLHLIVANARAEVYEAREPHGFPGYLGVWGCVYGHRPYFLGPLPYGSAEGSGGLEHETLAGTIAAYEESSTGAYGSRRAEWRVIVRNLRNGRVLHRVPTGAALNPEAGHVGVGNVVAILAKSDGAVAWIADDYERTIEPATLSEAPYFDLEAIDKSGSRLLASGTSIDPASLAFAIGGTNIGHGSLVRPGNRLYWTQGGQSFSTLLN